MINHLWDHAFRELFERCADQFRGGSRDKDQCLSAADKTFLVSIGYTAQEFWDFVDDHCQYGAEGPSLETALLIAAVRRDYLNVVQHGQTSSRRIPPSDLPAKTAEIDGIPWLPRLIAKARAKLRGEMDPDTMFGCGGDRAFFQRHRIHPADFLRAVWAADADDRRIVEFVKKGGVWH